MVKNIEKKIKQIRELKNFSQEHIANQLDISIRAYSKIEKGETQLTINRLNKLSEILEVSVQEILGFNASIIFNNNPVDQKGGHYVAYNNTEIEYLKKLYDDQIQNLKEEIAFLRSQMSP